MESGGVEQDELLSAIESILLVAADPVSIASIGAATGNRRRRIEEALPALAASLQRGIRLLRHGDTVQLVTAPENVDIVRRFLGAVKPAPLSRAALETLTVIAYRQPATRAEIDAVRGVDSDSSIRRLLARGLIEEDGRREVIGRPIEYRTSPEFLQYFGLACLDDLPPLDLEAVGAIDPADLGLRG